MATHFPFLWLCGPMGVGKSSVGWEMFNQLTNAGIKTGYADADQLGLCYPVPSDDPVNQRVKSRNVGAVLRTYQQAGARCFILSGSVYTAAEVRMYRRYTQGADLTLCMLRADPNIIQERFLLRGWQPHRVDEAMNQVAELDNTDFADLCVDIGNHSVEEVARMVRSQAGDWPGLA
jgi:hypothetical protein